MNASEIREKALRFAERVGVEFEDATGKDTIGSTFCGAGWWQDSPCSFNGDAIDLRGPWTNRTHGLIKVRFSETNGADRQPAVSLVLTLIDKFGRVLKPRSSDRSRGRRWLIDTTKSAVPFDGTEII